MFTNHKCKTTAVAFTPSNVFAVSGDEFGNVKIWWVDDFKIKKEYDSLLGGKICGFGWSDDNERLLVFGNGKQNLARTIMWDTGNNIGEISGHSKVLLAGDFKKTRPYRVITGGEDQQVNFYEGPPFKFKKMNKDHSNFVAGLKFSPDGNMFVSVGWDKKVFIYDSKTSDLLHSPNDWEGIHTSAIISVTWLDNNTFATASLDKTIKVCKLDSKTILTLVTSENPGVGNILAAVANNDKYVIGVTIDGRMHFWEISLLADKQFPTLSIDGHQDFVTAVVYNSSNKNVYSGDTLGKICK